MTPCLYDSLVQHMNQSRQLPVALFIFSHILRDVIISPTLVALVGMG